MEYELESLAANGPQMRAAIDVVPPRKTLVCLKESQLFPVFLSVRLPRV